MIVPVDATVEFATMAATDDLGETIVAGEAALFSGLAGPDVTAAGQFSLHLHENILWDDCLVVVLNIILRDNAGILNTLLGQEVCSIGLLQQGVAHVLLISKDLVDRAVVPFRISSSGESSICFQVLANFLHAVTFEVFTVDSFNDLGLHRVND